MDHIIEPTDGFDFKCLNLDQPFPLQGGNFYTKLSHGNNKLPLYVQLPNCKTRNGIVRGNLSLRKSYCDLLFTSYQTELISWLENFENKCREMIFEKRDMWFQNEMSLDDIENIFLSMMKSFRSGKFIMIRAHIPNTKQIKKEYCMVYDENEQLLELSDVNDNCEVIPLIQINGIKFSSKSFQIDVTLPQLMIIRIQDTVKNEFMIKHEKIKRESGNLGNFKNADEKNVSENADALGENADALGEKADALGENADELGEKADELGEKADVNLKDDNENNINMNEIERDVKLEMDEKNDNEEIKENNSKKKSSDLEEIDIKIEETDDVLSLKNPNEIYLGIYKAAKEKAKHMRKAAIEAYLEAKDIKTKYFLDDLENSDDNLSNFSDEDEKANSL